jgi:hypothetical protein
MGRTVVDKREDKEDTVCCAKRREGTMKEQGVLGLKRLGKTFLDLSLSVFSLLPPLLFSAVSWLFVCLVVRVGTHVIILFVHQVSSSSPRCPNIRPFITYLT